MNQHLSSESNVRLDKHAQLAERALRLKKAWLCAIAVMGRPAKITDRDLIVPNYKTWENRRLKSHIRDLEDDFDTVAKIILLDWNRASKGKISDWFAEQFNAWEKCDFGLFDLGRLHEVEKNIGRLCIHRNMDCPPYAQVLLQGLHGAAIRHPEYHLSKDIALLFNLLLDAEAILEEANRQRIPHNSESSQSLVRSVILTCFNLLEAFTSGLAIAWLIENARASDATAKRLQDNSAPLRKRFTEVPALISGHPNLIDGTRPPIEPLFGECKRRRDSFVHCEPGPTPTKWGYVKEEQFHDATMQAARRTVNLTFEAICLVWKALYSKEKPSWLPQRDGNGRFEKINVSLKGETYGH